jgi:phosphoserine phosphatase RsbU/P
MSDERKAILIIDDDITVRKLLNFHLKNSYTVYDSAGAAEGLEILNSKKIDIVLCDVTMEGIDGFTFCKQVRENDKYRVLPFIFITAKTSMEDKSRALEVGGDDLITKPFDVRELMLKVESLLRRSEIYKVYGAKKNLENSFTIDTPRILLIEDEVQLAKLFQYNFIKEGMECEIAFGAEEGLAKAKANPPDLIISDIMMPKVDGFTLRRIILQDEELKSIPFMFLTSKSEESDILDGYNLEITDYILKTAGPKVIMAKVNAILKSLGKERQKIVSELNQAAGSLRATVVPEDTPIIEGFEIKQWHIPFKGIPGGDFIDYFRLDENNLAIVLGDVMGKKWGAWYFAYAYAGYIRSAIRVAFQTTREFSPSQMIQQVNKSIYNDAKVSEVFATLSILILDSKNKVIKYSGAGDLPLLYRNASKGNVQKFISTGLLLGFSEEGNYNDISIGMQRGDSIIVVTDGILETRNSEGDQFGQDRLKEIMSKLSDEDDPAEKIKAQVVSFAKSRYEDDISLISIKAETG